eukprot:JZ548021.1.p4 GENE.JZ548021.1~~JZ548021.1.p4  ORF type:complete len:55 (-),score=2.17 JZ548021.1:136-300(-)
MITSANTAENRLFTGPFSMSFVVVVSSCVIFPFPFRYIDAVTDISMPKNSTSIS